MKIAIQIPIKSRTSTRVPNKNFRDLNGKPFFSWIIDEILKIDRHDIDIYIDSEDESAFQIIQKHYSEKSPKLKFHQRHEWLASDNANGNHLLSNFAAHHADYDIYTQAFVTAVTLKTIVIKEALDAFLANLDQYDSMTLVHPENGWVWYNGKAVNYYPNLPNGLPRSQDAQYLKETTGLYCITRDALFKTSCRVGEKPLLYEVDSFSAVDIDTMEDFRNAETLLKELSQPD